MEDAIAPHKDLIQDRSLANLARHISKFGLLPGCKIYLSNYYGTKRYLNIHVPGLPNKVALRNGTSDAHCFNQVFVDLDYDFDIGFEPTRIIDCGANIGLSSLFFHRKYPNATVVAVEPETSNFTMLEKNVRPYTNIKCLNNGIWNKTVNLEISSENSENEKWGFTVKEINHSSNTSIKAVTIIDIMNQFKMDEIDILKMDIEGSELEVFSSNYESWLPKTRILMIELHDRGKKNCSKTFFQSLFKYDFSINQYHRGEIIMCIRN